jgi:hypothetical protein
MSDTVSMHVRTVQHDPTATPWRALYICSASRSGSTLTDMLLGGHPDVASLGEVNFLGKAIALGEGCSCNEKVCDCPAWSMVYERIREGQGIDMLANPYAFRLWDARAVNKIDPTHQTRSRLLGILARKVWLETRERLPQELRRNVPLPGRLEKALSNKSVLYQTILDTWSKSLVVDSSKNAWEVVELYRRWPDRVKVVLLSRDGRGVYLSRRKGGRDPHASVRGWVHYYRRALPLLEASLPSDALYRLRYEDLAADPEHTMRALCDFAGLPYAAEMLDLPHAVRHMVNGNDTRFAPQKGIRLDERWRNELTSEDLGYFTRHGGAAMNRRLGYE